MSLRQALKSKFRAEKSDLDSMASSSILQNFPTEERLIEEVDDECPHLEKDCIDDSCSTCYETQLSQLQEQLVAVMLENEQYANEIKDLKTQMASDQLVKQLEKERERTRNLSEKLHEKESGTFSGKSPRLRRFVRKEKHTPDKLKLSEGGESSGTIVEKDDNNETLKEGDEEKELHVETPVQSEAPVFAEDKPKGLYGKVRLWWRMYLNEWAEDFTDTTIEDDDSAEEDADGDALTVRKLKDNLVRFSNATKPVYSLADSLISLLRWRSPGTTMLAFCVYMYTVYHGWLLPLFLFLLICQLLLNYIRAWFTTPNVAGKQDHDEGDMGVSDKFQLVLHVARKVQNQLGYMANCLEKIKNLMLWQQTEVTGHLFFALIVVFVAACIFPAYQIFTIAGFYLGFKLFIIDYLFFRFPRVQQKHDTTARLWKALPTDAQLDKKHNRAELDKLVVNQGVGASALTSGHQNFCELFNLPTTESPLPAWHAGRRCTLINKDKSLTGAFKNGRLYLTNSFLCFERSKSVTPKNLVFALKNISRVEKAKPYPWLPGGGMAIEVTMHQPEKTYIFGAILNRDETLDSIVEAGQKAGLPWASQMIEHEEPQPSCSAKKAI